ncbi:MAG: TolC family protein [Muribaculaceae bacterium]|nr:TolC family protein [Muribaculaceae bacterium]
MKRIMILAACAAVIWGAAAQTDTLPATWTLDDCIAWAKQENISLRRNRVSVERARISEKDARGNRLPTVSFSTSQSFNNRPFLSNSMTVNGSQVMTSSNKNSYSGNYGVSASMPLYDGGQISNNIKLQQINTQIAELTVDQSSLSLEEDVIRMYVQILYAQETVKQDSEQIVLAEQQLARSQALFKAGLLNRADVAQMESQLAKDQYQKVADETTLAQYQLQLKQLMELDGDAPLVLADRQREDNVLAPLPTKMSVYEAALASRPEVKAQQLAMDRSDIDVKIAQASGKPTINANAGMSTYNNSSGGNMFTQLKDQWSNSLGVSLSLPIWDHGKTKNAVATARLEKETAYLDLLDTQKALWKTIEDYWLQASTAQQRYVAAQTKVQAAQTGYDLTSEQFRLGMKNILELLTDKTTLSTSTQQMLQAKYMAMLNRSLLDLYARD